MDFECCIIILVFFTSTKGDVFKATSNELSWTPQHDVIGSSRPSCEQPGIFAVQGSCKDFYICYQGELSKFSCLHGEVFDHHSLSCATKSTVTSLPECTEEISQEEISQEEISQEKISQEEISQEEISQEEISQVEISQEEITQDYHKENTSSEHSYHYLEKFREDSFEGYKRSKRDVVSTSITSSIAACSLASVSNDIVNTGWLFTGYTGKLENGMRYLEENLNGIKGKMKGIEGKINGLTLSVIENQLGNRIRSQIMQLLIDRSKTHDWEFEGFHRLYDKYLKNSLRTAMKRGLLREKHLEYESNRSQMHISIGELENLINELVNDSMTHIKIGFDEISVEMRLSEIKPLVSLLLNVIGGIQKRFRKLESLSVDDKKEEMEKSGGLLEYLEALTLEDSMRDIIVQNSAIPRDTSDITATFMIEFLVHCLRIHFYKLSSIVSLNVYLAAHSLNAKDVIGFNDYISKVQLAILKLKQTLGISQSQGQIQEVEDIIRKVQDLKYSSDIPNIDHIVQKSINGINQIIHEAHMLINYNTELTMPNTIIGAPDFSHSSISVPNGKWELGKQVSYAIQVLSQQSISKIGIWSTPYTINEKSNPIIKLSKVSTGIVRLVYRKFNQEMPELIAIIDDANKTSLKDITRDLIDATTRKNETQAADEILALIKDAGSDIDQHIERKMTALHYAAKHGNLKVMKILIDNGANIHAKAYGDQEALHFAAIYGSKEEVRYLIDRPNREQISAQTNLLGLSPLHLAVANSHVETTEILLEKGAFTNIKGNDGITPLHISVAGNEKMIDALLDDGNVDINAVDEEGLTVLHYAARISNPIYAQKLLLCDDLDVNAKSDSHLTPIHLAAINGNVEIILELYKSEANISSVDADKSTALHYAAFHGNILAVAQLITLQPSLESMINIENKTALDFAFRNNQYDVVKLLTGDAETKIKIMNNELSKAFDTLESNKDFISKQLSTQGIHICNNSDTIDITSEEICSHVKYVDEYVTLLMSLSCLNVSYPDNPQYSKVFDDYDRDLLIAKENANIWRSGHSIKNDIALTMKLVTGFDKEYRRKFGINQQRVRKMVKIMNNEKIRVNETIPDLENRIKTITSALKRTNDSFILNAFQMLKASTQKELLYARQIMEQDIALQKELKEVIAFLEFVRKDSLHVQNAASDTKTKLKEFLRNLESDKSHFERHHNISSFAFEELEEDGSDCDEKLQNLKREVNELKQNIKRERQQIKELDKKIDELFKKKKVKAKTYEKKGYITAFSGFVFGIALYSFPGFREVALGCHIVMQIVLLAETIIAIDAIKEEKDFHMEQIKDLESKVLRYRFLIITNTKQSDEVKTKMKNYNLINKDLGHINYKTDILIDHINKTLTSVQVIWKEFNMVTTELSSLISRATNAKTELEMKNAKQIIYDKLANMECIWRDVFYKVMNFVHCTPVYSF